MEHNVNPNKKQNTSTYFWKLISLAPMRGLAIAIASAIWYGLPLAAGLLLRSYFDTLSDQGESGLSYGMITLLFWVVRAGRGFWWLGTGALAEYHLAVIAFILRRNLFRQILLKIDSRSHFTAGEFLNRFENDAETIAGTIFTAAIGAGELAATGVTFWVLFRINGLLTIIAFATPLITFSIMRSLGPVIQRLHTVSREASENVSTNLTDLLTNVQSFKTAGAEAFAIQRFKRLSDLRRQSAVRSVLISALAYALNYAAISVTTGLILFVVSLRLRNLSTGDFALFASYVTFGDGVVGEVASWLVDMMHSLQQAAVSMHRLTELVAPGQQEVLLDTSPPYLHGDIQVIPTAKPSIDRHLTVLKVAGFNIGQKNTERTEKSDDVILHRGEIVVISGRVGSGKSQLLELILGFRDIPGFQVSWNEELIQNRADWFVPPQCGYVPQAPHLFSETLRDNILLGYPADDMSVENAVWHAVLEQDLSSLESGIETMLGSRGVNLSGGQIQRTAAARAFVRNPELLLLDDISSALDVETEEILWDRLFSRVSRPTCLIVSHRQSLMQRADRVIVLKDGKIEDQAPLPVLLERCPEMQYLWEIYKEESRSQNKG